MLGAILGDMIGSPFQFDVDMKSRSFPLFTEWSVFTDDTVMTVAIAEALLDAGRDASLQAIERLCVQSMQKWGHRYPQAGYGSRFLKWLESGENARPYGSWGNGSAMRVSACGWLYDSLERTREVARATAAVTHNHPAGLRGAEATASVIYLARTRTGREKIRAYIDREFGYDLNRTIDAIRPEYKLSVSCQRTVPEAIIGFLEGRDFEDVIRNVVSLGGDTDTTGAIAGSMAEAFFGIPQRLIAEGLQRLPRDMVDVIRRFYEALS